MRHWSPLRASVAATSTERPSSPLSRPSCIRSLSTENNALLWGRADRARPESRQRCSVPPESAFLPVRVESSPRVRSARDTCPIRRAGSLSQSDPRPPPVHRPLAAPVVPGAGFPRAQQNPPAPHRAPRLPSAHHRAQRHPAAHASRRPGAQHVTRRRPAVTAGRAVGATYRPRTAPAPVARRWSVRRRSGRHSAVDRAHSVTPHWNVGRPPTGSARASH